MTRHNTVIVISVFVVIVVAVVVAVVGAVVGAATVVRLSCTKGQVREILWTDFLLDKD